MAALWRGIFMGNEAIKEPHVRVIAEYIDRELADVYDIDAVRLSCFCICVDLFYPFVKESLNRLAGVRSLSLISCYSVLVQFLHSDLFRSISIYRSVPIFLFVSWKLHASEGLTILQMSCAARHRKAFASVSDTSVLPPTRKISSLCA